MARMGFCSACDRNVPVVLRDAPAFGRVPSPSDAEALVCLDYGVRCTGALCPLFSAGPDARPSLPTVRTDVPQPAARP